MNCRFCKTELSHVFVDLHSSPAANSFVSKEQLNEPEMMYPLKVYTCSSCFLVQIDEFKTHDSIFDDQYLYFSSYSKSWLQHAKAYTEKVVERFQLNKDSQVVEIASNDGYLLQYFKEHGIPVLGIEPTANTAREAEKKGIKSIVEFFGTQLATKLLKENTRADLLIGNNVLAHVPDIVDFVRGLKIALNEGGVITMEFPHLLQLVEQNQFDTIYHEHFSYLSFYTVQKIFAAQGLQMFDVEEITTHGGSLRIYAKHAGDRSRQESPNVAALLEKEISRGMNTLAYYENFQQKVAKVKTDFNDFLLVQKQAGKKIAGYGAAAKGNTLLNYCQIKHGEIDFVVDANPHKQNKWLPSSHIPVVEEAYLQEYKPDYIVIFPWNLKTEIVEQLNYAKVWGAKFVTAVPVLTIIEDSVKTIL
jgi:2-polyprenyl-3-methyl-5-hydroxy-6-metoxy-1,4-benzoquinol methylase